MNEFEFIDKYISPLCEGIGDDVAKLEKSNLVMTKDVLIEGVHFLKNTKPSVIAKKSLRVNLSDIASSGARPKSYLLGLILPNGTTEEWIRDFFQGIKEDNQLFGIKLIGGDTTSHDGKVIISVTMIGETIGSGAILRSGSSVGDGVYVSGTIGDSAFGLLSYIGSVADSLWLKKRYDFPEARVNLGIKLCEIASACIDISDGLLQDANHICRQSNVGMNIYFDDIPISDALSGILTSSNREVLLTGGDDYELLFTSRYDAEKLLPDFKITKVGDVKVGTRVKVLDSNNTEIKLSKLGYSHF